MKRPLILGSGSPRRKWLMEKAGYDFEVVTADVVELEDNSIPPVELTEKNASLKASAVAALHPASLVIGADTLVFIDQLALGKPVDMNDARGMIARLEGRTHQVCTAVCFRRLEPDLHHVFHEITDVTFRSLDARGIDEYLSKIDPLDKAGGYAAQEYGELIIERTEGSYSNVVGLPMERLKRELKAVPLH